MDFKYIFICRSLPFLLPGPAATSVLFLFLLWRTFWKWFCWIGFFFLWGRTYFSDHFLRGQDRRRKVTGKKFPLLRQSPPSLCCWPLWDRCPGLRALTLRVLVGGFCFKVSGWWWFFFFFNFGVCACVCIVLRLHIYSSPSKRWPPPWTAAQWTIRLGKKTLLAAVPPGSSRSHFECVFPSAGALDSSLVIICLWKWETGIVDPTHILNL